MQHFFRKAVPGLARGAFAHPFGTFITALAAKKSCFYFAHAVKVSGFGEFIELGSSKVTTYNLNETGGRQQ